MTGCDPAGTALNEARTQDPAGGGSEKNRTAFEYAAAYALCRERERKGEGLSGWLLVLDLDRFEAGLCACEAAGFIDLKGDVRVDGSPPGSFLRELERLAGAEARARFAEQEKQVKKIYKKYLLGGKETDREVYGGVTCSLLEQAFSQTAAALRRLLPAAEDLYRQKKVEESHLRILMIGDMARNYLAEYLVRKQFSRDPFGDDPIYWTPPDEKEDPALFVRVGRELYEAGKVRESRPVGCRVVLTLLDREGGRAAVELARPEQSLAELEPPSYSPPFLCCSEEPISLEVDGARREIPIPKALFQDREEAAMLRAAVVLRGGDLCLGLCGADDPKNQTQIPITIS